MAMKIGLAQVVLPPCGSEDGSRDHAPTAAQAKREKRVTLSRGSSQRRVATAEPELSLEFEKLAAEIVTPDFESMDDQSYNAAMVKARNEFRGYGAGYGLVIARKVLPGIDDAARRFQEHKADKDYRLNGQDNLTAYIDSLGYKPATLRKWRQRIREQELVQKIKLLTSNTGAENGSGKSGKPPRAKYDATDIAHLERIALAAEIAANEHLDDDAFNPVRDAIQNKPEGMPEAGSQDQIVTLAVEGSEIIFNLLGDKLMGTPEGKRLVQIARKILELSRKRLRNRTTPKNLDGREHHGESRLSKNSMELETVSVGAQFARPKRSAETGQASGRMSAYRNDGDNPSSGSKATDEVMSSQNSLP